MSTLAAPISCGWGISGVSLGYTIYKTDGTVAQARTTTGVTEAGTSGEYDALPTFNSTWGVWLRIVWDDGTTTSRASETIQNPATILPAGSYTAPPSAADIVNAINTDETSDGLIEVATLAASRASQISDQANSIKNVTDTLSSRLPGSGTLATTTSGRTIAVAVDGSVSGAGGGGTTRNITVTVPPRRTIEVTTE